MSENNDKELSFGEPSGFSKWFDNFWYHYKIYVILAAVAIVTVVICVSQMLGKEKYDYQLLYAGPQVVAVQDAKYIEKAFAEVGSDVDGNGEVSVAFNDVVLLSDEEMAAAKQEGAVFNPEFVRQSRLELSQHVMAGDSFLFILSPYNYEELKKSDAFLTLAELLGETPDYAYDDCAIRLSDTAFGTEFQGVNKFPEDTLICVRKVTSVQSLRGSERAEELQQRYIDLFRAIVEHVPEAQDAE